jgi:hypothetical protein
MFWTRERTAPAASALGLARVQDEQREHHPRANSRCFQRTGQRFGQGTPGVGNGNGSPFQGVQGTIDTINSGHLTFHDAQGQEYSVAITSATVIQQTALAKISDLKVGMNVVVVGSASSSGIAARTIAIQG